jgi:adenylate cyclase
MPVDSLPPPSEAPGPGSPDRVQGPGDGAVVNALADESPDAEVETPSSEQVTGEQAALLQPPLDIWERVRKHKVVQWTLVYAAATLPVLHGLALVSDALDWPHVIVRVVTLLLLLGLPITTTLAWVHGHRAPSRVSGTELVILTVLLTLAGGVLWLLGPPNKEAKGRASATTEVIARASTGDAPTEGETPPENSVAVLPFVNMSNDKNNEYFADGLSEELTDLLTQVRDLQVPSRTSSSYFKGRSATVAEIGRALNVAHLLEGSVRRSGNALRVTVQLIRVDNGYHLWSKTFDRQLDDIFKIQDDIAGSVVKTLKVSLLEGESLPTAPTTNPETYELYLQARSLRRLETAADVEMAIDRLRQATRSDSRFAPAWAQLSLAVKQNWEHGGPVSVETARADANAAADQAIEIDPKLASGHVAKGLAALQFDWDWDTADAELRRAVQLDPGDAEALVAAAQLSLYLGRLDEAIRFVKEAAVRDPLGPAYTRLSVYYWTAGRLIEAEVAGRRALDLHPALRGQRFRLAIVLLARNEPAAALAEIDQEENQFWRHVGRAMTLGALGRQSEADQELAYVEQHFADNGAYQIAEIYASRHDLNRAFVWLDRACNQRDSGLLGLKVDPLLKNLRGDPRYKALLLKMRFPE